jgi:hypothetical protein
MELHEIYNIQKDTAEECLGGGFSVSRGVNSYRFFGVPIVFVKQSQKTLL